MTFCTLLFVRRHWIGRFNVRWQTVLWRLFHNTFTFSFISNAWSVAYRMINLPGRGAIVKPHGRQPRLFSYIEHQVPVDRSCRQLYLWPLQCFNVGLWRCDWCPQGNVIWCFSKDPMHRLLPKFHNGVWSWISARLHKGIILLTWSRQCLSWREWRREGWSWLPSSLLTKKTVEKLGVKGGHRQLTPWP